MPVLHSAHLHNDPLFPYIVPVFVFSTLLPPSLLLYPFLLSVSFFWLPSRCWLVFICSTSRLLVPLFILFWRRRDFPHPPGQPSAPPNPLTMYTAPYPGVNLPGRGADYPPHLALREELLLIPRLFAFVVYFVMNFTFTIFLPFAYV